MIDKAFTETDIRRVLAETMVVNAASRVMEKSGLRQLRIFRADWPDTIPGDEHGDVEYGLDRQDWERQRMAPSKAGSQP